MRYRLRWRVIFAKLLLNESGWRIVQKLPRLTGIYGRGSYE